MKIIPSIDLLNGQCVRLVRGVKASAVAYEQTPLEIAEGYAQYGARLIHVVDLDGAFSGQMQNIEIIRALAQRFPIQVGGGIRSEDQLVKLLSFGVRKAVVGTLMFRNPGLFSRLKEKYAGCIIGSFDFKQGQLCYAGWTQQTSLSFETTVQGLSEIIVTDVERDGTLTGPNPKLLQEIRKRCSADILAAGGVRDLWDVRELKRFGIAGVIIGKAFLENKIKLANGVRFERMVD